MRFLVTLTTIFSILLAACSSAQQNGSATVMSPSAEGADRESNPDPKVLIGLSGDTLSELELTDAEWKERLAPEAYYILREHGTERAFTSPLNEVKEEGMFVCAACELPLFASETKFKSGTGWPSFYEPVRPDHITAFSDNSYGMTRTEVRCGRCDGHQGHVFKDGPQPTGLRYCINGDALSFVPQQP